MFPRPSSHIPTYAPEDASWLLLGTQLDAFQMLGSSYWVLMAGPDGSYSPKHLEETSLFSLPRFLDFNSALYLMGQPKSQASWQPTFSFLTTPCKSLSTLVLSLHLSFRMSLHQPAVC